MNASRSNADGPRQGGPPPSQAGGPFEVSPAQICDGRRVILDTEAFFASGASQAIVTGLAPALNARRERLLVLTPTVRTIAQAFSTPGRSPIAKYQSAKAILEALENADAWLCIDDPHASEHLAARRTATLISDFVLTYQLSMAFYVVTQNERLARQLLDNVSSPAIQSVRRNVSVAYIDNGKFYDWRLRLNRRDGREPAENELEKRIARDYRIIVDTCSLMLPSRPGNAAVGLSFIRARLLPELLKHGSKMIIPQRVCNELQNNSIGIGDKQKVAKEVLAFLGSADAANAIIRAGDEGELVSEDPNFADPVLVRAQRFQGEHNICFITQDENLAQLLLDNHDPSSGKDYQVVFITFEGTTLGNWEKKLVDNERKRSAENRAEIEKKKLADRSKPPSR